MIELQLSTPIAHRTTDLGFQRSSRVQSILVAGAAMALLGASIGCAGKKRPFASESIADGPNTGAAGTQGEGDFEQAELEDGEGAEGTAPSTEPRSVPGSFLGNRDAGSRGSLQPTSMASCEDACSGECAPGDTQCASTTDRIECGVDALWGDPSACQYVCLDGVCAGECVPGATECISSTRFRSCADVGVWSEPSECANACVEAACGGECRPGQTRCSSNTTVQTCDENGQWGGATACQNACSGEACAGECVPGSARCSSETQLQTCNQQGQFQQATSCQFACTNGGCGGECSPGTRRCNPGNGAPQFCSNAGLWQTQAPCQFVCTGSGSCSGECIPGARRCSPVSGVPQLCSSTGIWQNQAACQFVCGDNGNCGGECTPGSRRCSQAGIPQLCSPSGLWQNQNGCPGGQECRLGDCVMSAPPPTLVTSAAPGQIPQTLVGTVSAPVRWTIINSGGQPTQALALVRDFSANEFTVESSCIGVPLAPGNACVLNITFTPQRPAGSRSATFTVTAGTLTVRTTLASISVRYGAGQDCTTGASGECQPGLFCQPWFLDQDLDGYGGEERFGGAPAKTTCSNQPNVGRPADMVIVDSGAGGFPVELALPYLPIGGDCCDVTGDRQRSSLSVVASDVNPGITVREIRPAPRCALPEDYNCDGVEDCITVPAGPDGTSCL
jgi:hypothetical protein